MLNDTKTFYCSSTEWHMARAYSDAPLAGDEHMGGKGNWFLPPLILLIGSAIGSMIHMHWIWIVGIVASFPLFLFCYQRRYNGFYQNLIENYHFAKSELQIPFVSFDAQQLNCHFYRADGSISHRIRLSEIDSFAFTTLSYNLNKFKLPVLLNQKAKQQRAEIIPELWTDQSRFVLTIYVKTKVMSRCRLLIPKQWLEDDTLARFLQLLEQKTDKQLDYSYSNPADVLNYFQQYTIPLRK